MDWFMDSADVDALPALRREMVDYLRRHAEPGSDLDAAEVVFSELVTNAVRHAGGPVWTSVDWSAREPVITVHDLGPGFHLEDRGLPQPSEHGGLGLYIVTHMTEHLEVARKRAGGAKVSAVLPVTRRREVSHDPPRRASGALPDPEEARPDGTFGRESFLRALVVQLAQTVEREQGPQAAEAVVAQVGVDVGSRMEDRFREVEGITGRLTPEQMGELYVRLKRAIEGDFYVIEASDDRIVLGNRRCPFGEAVKRSPALCRMTSSVFGGIAARNRGASAVRLEERIAVGDPGCRVVVWLGDAARQRGEAEHVYGRSA
ncbi:MAG TPA: methanogen output domain 1-containing protein [Actinomycetota bacterium]|nr:methanogen output domain 1-containing protein [Actinomycetota bacterium]